MIKFLKDALNRLPHKVKRLLLGLIAAFIILEVIAGIILIILINFKSYQDFKSIGKAELLSYVSWFDDRYEYHPFLGYAQKKVDENVRLAPHDPEKLRLAIQGGSFAMFFADFLKSPKAKESLDNLAADLGYKDIVIIDMAAGGHRQPQQVITSSLWSHLADFFVSIEGFNEYAEKTHLCLPPEWPRGAMKFNPGFKTLWYGKSARFFKTIFLGHYSWSESFDPLGKVSFFFISNPIISLYFSAEADFFESLNESSYCKNLTKSIKEKFSQQMDERNSDWEKFIRRHHLLHSPKSNLLTIFQPNQHYTGSKPLSQNEIDILAGRKFDFIDIKYPKGREMFSKLSSEGLKVYDFTMIYKSHTQSYYKDYCCHVNDDGNLTFLKNLIPLLKKHVPPKE